MSLWTCPEHGLYGGQIDCPTCGMMGNYVVIEDDPPPDPERHAWDDLKDELRREP